MKIQEIVQALESLKQEMDTLNEMIQENKKRIAEEDRKVSMRAVINKHIN